MVQNESPLAAPLSSFVIRHSSFVGWFFRAVWAAALLAWAAWWAASSSAGRATTARSAGLDRRRSYVDATRTLQELEDKVRAELTRSLPAGKESGRGPAYAGRRRHGRRAGGGRRAAETGRGPEVGNRRPTPRGRAGRRHAGLSEPQHRGDLRMPRRTDAGSRRDLRRAAVLAAPRRRQQGARRKNRRPASSSICPTARW